MPSISPFWPASMVSVCPSCSQDISEDLKSEKIDVAKSKASELKTAMDHAVEKSDALESDLDKITEQLSEIREKQTTRQSKH